MSYTRDCVPANETVVLRAIFTDACGLPHDVDNIDNIEIAIYRPDDVAATTSWDDEIDNAYPNSFHLYSNDEAPAGAATFGTISKVATGFYEVEYTANDSDADGDGILDNIGNWTDLWIAEVDGIQVNANFAFKVVGKGKATQQKLENNSLVAVILSDTIAGVSGDTLQTEIQVSYSTEYKPYYASVDLLRLECGSWLDGIPEDTLSLMIHWSSITADALKGQGWKGKLLKTARTKFVIYDAALRCLQLPADVGGKKKALGDLLIETTSDFSSVLLDIKKTRDEWERVINAGGTIVPGQSLNPSIAARGAAHREMGGRLWHDPSKVYFGQPSRNTKFSLDGIKKKSGWAAIAKDPKKDWEKD